MELKCNFLTVIVNCSYTILADNADIELSVLEHAGEFALGSTYSQFLSPVVPLEGNSRVDSLLR